MTDLLPQSTPLSSDLPGTDSSAAKHQFTSKSHTGQPHSSRPRTSELTGTDTPVIHRQDTSRISNEPARNDSVSSMESDVESELSDRPQVDIYVEKGELSEDQDATITDPVQSL